MNGLYLLSGIFLACVVIIIILFRYEMFSLDELHKKECDALQHQLDAARSKMDAMVFSSRRDILIKELEAGTRDIMAVTHGRSSEKQTQLFHDLYQKKLHLFDWPQSIQWQDEMLNRFHERLMADHPRLTLQNQQMALLFMLDTPNYVVAILLDMAESSIPTTKSRLGHKLGQESSLLLQTYLIGLLCTIDD